MYVLDRLLKIGLLLDLYGALLTEKQRSAVEMHFSSDLSLTEIGAELGVSRQAVHDIIHRAEAALVEYEEKLGFLARRQTCAEAMALLGAALGALPEDLEARAEIEYIKTQFEKLRSGFEEA